ncbi:MAG: hypothetical protein ABL927_01690 [Bdellovibrionales bacterium]
MKCLLYLFICFSIQHYSNAAEIKTIKGHKLILNLQNDKFEVGNILKINNHDGKKVGLVKILKIKNDQALGQFKGDAEIGFTAVLRTAEDNSQEASHATTAKASNYQVPDTSKQHYGFLFGLSQNSAQIKFQNTNTSISPTGMGFGLSGLYDMHLFNKIYFRGLAGLEQFKTGGVSDSNCSGECTDSITFINLDFWGRYKFSKKTYQPTFQPWLGGGFNLMFAAAKSTKALNSSQISHTNVFAFGGGVDIRTSQKNYIPVQLEYDIYAPSETVKASAITLRAGYALNF